LAVFLLVVVVVASDSLVVVVPSGGRDDMCCGGDAVGDKGDLMVMANKSAQSGGNCSAIVCDGLVAWSGGGGGGRRRGLTKGEGAGGDLVLTVKCGFCSSGDRAQNGLFKMTTIDGSSSSSSASAFSCRLLDRHSRSSSSSSGQHLGFLPLATSISSSSSSSFGQGRPDVQGVTNKTRHAFQQIIYRRSDDSFQFFGVH
jgi:hypothetical protein